MASRQKIYAAGCNLGGLWSDKPLIMHYHKNLNEYYDRSGNVSVKRLGLDIRRYSLITFASLRKKDVELFIAGAKTMSTFIRGMAWADFNKKK